MLFLAIQYNIYFYLNKINKYKQTPYNRYILKNQKNKKKMISWKNISKASEQKLKIKKMIVNSTIYLNKQLSKKIKF